jgi:hypothetical protein
VIAAHAVEPLPDGALVPALNATNTHDRASVTTAINRVIEKLGRPRRVGLVVPDVVAKVSLLKFEKIPPRVQDLDQLVRWQVRKSAPFPIEEAQVSFVNGQRAADGQELIVSLARRSVIEEYEQLCAEAGAYAGLVDLATFNVINAVLAGRSAPAGGASTGAPEEDWLLVNVAADSASIALLRGSHLIFFRNRAADTDGTLADLVHQTAMYYQDRLQGAGFARVLLAGRSGCARGGRSRPGAPDDRRAPDGPGQHRRSARRRHDRRPDFGGAGAARHAHSARRSAAARPQSGHGAGVIRTNLSTRPFYNERAVHLWLLIVALIVGRGDRS